MVGPGRLPERIEAMVSTAVGYAARSPAAAHIILREAASTDPALCEEIRNRATPFLELLFITLEEGEQAGLIHPTRSDPFHFVASIAGTIIFYVAALPTVARELPYEHLASEQVEILKRDVLKVTRRLLGFNGPRRASNRAENHHRP